MIAIACYAAPKPYVSLQTTVGGKPIQQPNPKELINEIIDHGQGVYFFPFVGDNFRETISKFLSINTNMEVVAFSPDVAYQAWPNNDVNGFTVIFRQKR